MNFIENQYLPRLFMSCPGLLHVKVQQYWISLGLFIPWLLISKYSSSTQWRTFRVYRKPNTIAQVLIQIKSYFSSCLLTVTLSWQTLISVSYFWSDCLLIAYYLEKQDSLYWHQLFNSFFKIWLEWSHWHDWYNP